MRGAQFKNFAENIVKEIMVDEEQNLIIFDLDEEEQSRIVEILARRAYDLVAHTVEHLDPKDLDMLDLQETVERIPDLPAFETKSYPLFTLPHMLFAIQARARHKKYGVSAEYMEIALRIEYYRKKEKWDAERYDRELMALAMRFPDDVVKHLEYDERRDNDAKSKKQTNKEA